MGVVVQEVMGLVVMSPTGRWTWPSLQDSKELEVSGEKVVGGMARSRSHGSHAWDQDVCATPYEH